MDDLCLIYTVAAVSILVDELCPDHKILAPTSVSWKVRTHSGKPVTIRESNEASGVRKAQYRPDDTPSISLAFRPLHYG